MANEYLELGCSSGAGNTGKQNCVENFGQVDLLAVVPASFEIATKTLANTEATWITAINAARATRLYPLFGHFNGEIEQEGLVKADGWAGKSRPVRNGKTSAIYTLEDISFYNHRELRKHNGRSGLAIYRITSQGYIQGWSDDDIVFKPIPVSFFNVNDRTESTGEDIDSTMIEVEYENFSYHWNDNGVWVKPTAFDPLLLDGIKDVSISGTLGATTETVTVQGASDQVGFVGLVDANFRLYDDAAPTVAIAVTAVDNLDGTYDTTHASISGAHTMTLFDQPIGTSGAEAVDEINTTV